MSRRLFEDVDEQYKFAAKQGYGQWTLFVNKPKWDATEKRWFDNKNPYETKSFNPANAPEVDPEKSLFSRNTKKSCCF